MIFADSSYFIAIVREKDQWHDAALKLTGKINESLLISDLIISECITLVGSLEGGKAGKLLYEYFIDNCKIYFMDGETLTRSVDTFLKYDGTLSLADAASVEIMRLHKVKNILSFDSDFDKIKKINRIF